MAVTSRLRLRKNGIQEVERSGGKKKLVEANSCGSQGSFKAVALW